MTATNFLTGFVLGIAVLAGLLLGVSTIGGGLGSSSSSSSSSSPGAGASSADARRSTDKLAVAEAIHWLRRHGGVFDGLDVIWGPFGRGLKARRRIGSEDDIIVVPKHLMLTEFSARAASPMSQVVDDVADLGIADSFLLALQVEWERHNLGLSFWAPYIRTMGPIESPLVWSEGQLAELQSEHLASTMREERKYVMDLYAAAFPVLFKTYPGLFPRPSSNSIAAGLAAGGIGGVPGVQVDGSSTSTSDGNAAIINNGVVPHSPESWLNSVAQVWARSFNIEANNTYQWGMVPVADLVNHNPNIENNYLQGGRGFYMRHPGTPRPLEKGEEMLIT
eukprot:g5186.t1